MPPKLTPTKEIYEALFRRLNERDALVAKAVESAYGYRFQNGILYLRYPEYLNNISARILLDPQHWPSLDQAAAEIAIQVALE